MVKSKLLEFDKTLEDEVCSNVLFRLHKVIDESFPTAAQASGKFSQTVVANYDKLNPALRANQDPASSMVLPTPPLPQPIAPRASNKESSSTPTYSPYSSPYSQQIFSSAADSVYVPKSKQKKSFFRSFIRTKRPRKAAKNIPTTDFEKSRSDEIFSDRYLNKVARRSKPGIIRTSLKLTLFALVVITVTIFVMGKQKRALQLIKDFPTYYSQQLKPKLEEFKSYFNSDSSSETQEENSESSSKK